MTNRLGPLSSKVINMLESEGPKSVSDLCSQLGISNGSSRSVLVKLHKAGKIDRIGKGVYRMYDDDRKYSKI